MVGIEAVMRASEVTLPSLTGTLRSARMKTRFPLRSRSVMRMKLDMGGLLKCSKFATEPLRPFGATVGW
jgi:hypothetical protein